MIILTFMEVFCTCTAIPSSIHWNNSELKQVTCTAIIPQGEVISRRVQWAASTRDNSWIVWISHIGDFNNVPKVRLYSSNVQCKWGYPVEMYCGFSSGCNFKIVDWRWWTLYEWPVLCNRVSQIWCQIENNTYKVIVIEIHVSMTKWIVLWCSVYFTCYATKTASWNRHTVDGMWQTRKMSLKNPIHGLSYHWAMATQQSSALPILSA